jgi:hypothetical protein
MPITPVVSTTILTFLTNYIFFFFYPGKLNGNGLKLRIYWKSDKEILLY